MSMIETIVLISQWRSPPWKETEVRERLFKIYNRRWYSSTEIYKWRWYNSTELYTIVVGTIVQRDIQSACNAILYAAGGCTLHKNNFTLISAPGVQVADPPSFQIALPSWILSYLGTRIWIWMCLYSIVHIKFMCNHLNHDLKLHFYLSPFHAFAGGYGYEFVYNSCV